MSKQTKATTADHNEGPAERASSINEKVSATGRKANRVLLDSYEKTAVTMADAFEKSAGATKIGWVSKAAGMQASASRKIARAYADNARKLVA